MRALYIDLDLPASERWLVLTPFAAEIRLLVSAFFEELAGFARDSEHAATIMDFWTTKVDKRYQQEISAIAELASITEYKLIVVNLYYDLLKTSEPPIPGFGCSAFAVDTPSGPLHARNLDWYSPNQCLADTSFVFNFTRQSKCVYSTVSWPGYIGTLSGQAHGKFSITLNTVASTEQGQLGHPISLAIRSVLEQCDFYADAVNELRDLPLMNDCLLLVCGVMQGEYCVIERTPRIASVRKGCSYIVATNHYESMSGLVEDTSFDNAIFSTACGRFEQIEGELTHRPAANSDAAFRVLNKVKMLITVQQMAFMPKVGQVSAKAVSQLDGLVDALYSQL